MKKLYSFILSLTLLWIGNTQSLNAQVLAQDSLALVDLYNSTDGANWNSKTNWLSGPVSSWYGITVSSNRVTSIALYNNNLSGTIYSSFGDLSELTSVYLILNKVDDPLPSSIGNLSKLQTLYLSNNLLDSLPQEIQYLTLLENLNISNNDLTELPEELANLSLLNELRAGGNNLTQFPYFIGKMTQMEELELSNNSFSIPFPDTLYNLVNAQMIDIASCDISGTLDSRVGNWTNLVWFYFANNKLSGNIPKEVGNLTNLTFLELYGNDFSGSIPEEIGNLSNLVYLRLNDNELSDSIPDTLYALANLKEISLENNQIEGIVNPLIAKLTNLETLHLQNNKLNALFPSSIDSLKNLESLKINDNDFSQLLDISSLTNLQTFAIENNKFTFEDIEPNINVAPGNFSYSPQDSVKSKMSFSLNEGDSLVVNSIVGGSSNQYQWYKNGVILTGETSDTLTLLGVKVADAGQYTCEITSSIVTGLTLYRRPILVSVSPVTSIKVIEAQNSILLYQDPSFENLLLYSSNNTNQSILIYDINGKVVKRFSISTNYGKIDLSFLPKGFYIAEALCNEGKKTVKIYR